VWGDTRIVLPPEAGLGGSRLRDVFTGVEVDIRRENGRAHLRAAEIFERFPLALLT
jgi:hypothetical protein